jgi:hypothetical protein
MADWICPMCNDWFKSKKSRDRHADDAHPEYQPPAEMSTEEIVAYYGRRDTYGFSEEDLAGLRADLEAMTGAQRRTWFDYHNEV